jgi:nickel/cobalt transporter (NicO) family protein
MILLAASSAFVGLIHSLAPGHWLPVVLMARTRRWPIGTAILGALVAASGHVFLSIVLGVVGITAGANLLMAHEETIERYSGLLLILFGLIYAALAYFRHKRCHGHEHHGPPVDERKGPFLFLFSLGLSPCIAVLPVFGAAASMGTLAVGLSMAGFAVGVIAALAGATVLVTLGVMKLDHPIFEHYGDVITGVAVALMGGLLVAGFLSH